MLDAALGIETGDGAVKFDQEMDKVFKNLVKYFS
jgi:hypothetical protein